MTIGISFTFNTPPEKRITTEEVRDVIREISNHFYGEILTSQNINHLNCLLDEKVNKKFGLNIKANISPNHRSQIYLEGYDADSKAVLDPNCKIKYISTNLPLWRQ